jgi:hypothetical protein
MLLDFGSKLGHVREIRLSTRVDCPGGTSIAVVGKVCNYHLGFCPD